MKPLLLSALLLYPIFTHATESPCKAKAIQAAMAEYLKQGSVQGDDPIPSYQLIKSAEQQITHSVTIDGGNDEGEAWAIVYRVKTTPAPACKVASVKKVKTL